MSTSAINCKHIHSGKVRETYEIPGEPGLLAVLASDRISTFDFVLRANEIPCKGAVLTAMTVFWLTEVLRDFPHHLECWGKEANERYNLGFTEEQATRLLVVKRANPLPIEAIMRGNLVGSGWKSYQASGEVCGIKLPDGMQMAQELDPPIFTPTTKAVEGHDEHIDSAETVARYPGIDTFATDLFTCGRDYAKTRGIIIADTKFEFGLYNGQLILIDEVLTPDSSRFWPSDQLVLGSMPPSFDKDFVREYVKTLETPFGVTGIQKLEPTNYENANWVATRVLPSDVILKTTENYLKCFELMTGMSLDEFQAKCNFV